MAHEAASLTSSIRRARPEESDLLTGLTLRSKAHWGYDEAFLSAARPHLEFQASKFLPDFHVDVLEVGSEPVGFCSLVARGDEAMELHDLFIEPRYIGKGYGKELWNHAVGVAKALGFRKIVLTADSNAESFYLRRGAVQIGDKLSPVSKDRMLPVMEYVLAR